MARSPTSPATRPRTEGQRQLLALGTSGAELARQLEVSKQTVSCWRSGEKLPGLPTRSALELACGIPVIAWEQAPAGQPEPPPTTPTQPDAAGPISTRAEAIETYRSLSERKRQLPADTAEGERNKLDSLILSALTLLSRMDEREESSMERFLKSAEWRRMRGVFVTALVPHPEAAKAVAEALTALGIAA